MKLYHKLITTVTTILLSASSAQAFEVISAEDVNTGGNGTRASLNLSLNAETQFLNKLTTDVGTEEFENYDWATPANLSLIFPGAGTATLTGNGEVNSITHIPGESLERENRVNRELLKGRYASSGSQYWRTSASVGGGSTFTINMTEEIAAFGFYAYDLGDFGGQLAINLYKDGQLVGTIDNTTHNLYATTTSGGYTGSAIYIGIIGEKMDDGSYETFDQVEFEIVNSTGTSEDFFAFDDMTIATPLQIQEVVFAD